MPEEERVQLIVLRCASCGDTFSAHAGTTASCPTCGGTELDVAGEPLL